MYTKMMWFFIGKNKRKYSENVTEWSSWMNLNRSESFANAALMPKNSKQWTSTRVYTRPSPVTFSWFKAETFTNLLIVAINHAKKSIDSQTKIRPWTRESREIGLIEMIVRRIRKDNVIETLVLAKRI